MKLTGVEYTAHTHQVTNKHKIIIQYIGHVHIPLTMRCIWIFVSCTLIRWSHRLIHWGHNLWCCSQLYIHYKTLLQLRVSVITFSCRTCLCQFSFCWIYWSYITSKFQSIQMFYNFLLTTNRPYSICQHIQTLCTYQISYHTFTINIKYYEFLFLFSSIMYHVHCKKKIQKRHRN